MSEDADDWLPLAPNQREIWFHQALEPESPTYNVGGYLDCPLRPDIDRLQRAWDLVVARHDATRLEIREDAAGSPTQRFLDEVPTQLDIVDFQHREDPVSEAVRWMDHAMDCALDLSRAPLFQPAVLLVAPGRFFFFLKCHHVLMDGWTFSLLTQDMAAIYSGLGTEPIPAGEGASYRPFIQSYQAYLDSEKHQRDLEFWRKVYPALPAPVIPENSRARSGRPTCGKTVLEFERSFYDRLERLTGDPKATAFHAMLAALHAAFVGFRSDAGMTVGLPILNRVGKLQRRTAGMFVQAIPFRVEPPADATCAEAVRKLAADLRDAYRHRHCPLSEINRAIGFAGSGRAQMFDMTLSFERHDYEGSMDGVPLRAVPLTNSFPALPLSVFVREFSGQSDVEVEFVFREDCLPTQTVEWLTQRFRSVLETFVRAPGGRFGDVPRLSDGERAKLDEWNRTQADLPEQQTVIDLFESVVARNGSGIAVRDSGAGEVDYKTLDARANRLAAFLVSAGCRPGAIVGVRLQRGLDLVTCFLGILKAGLVYLPLGAEEGNERLSGIVKDAEAEVVLTTVLSDTSGDMRPGRVIHLPEIRAELEACSPGPIRRTGSPADPAYCIFTSGSTGEPKGVLIGHQGLMNMTLEAVRLLDVTPDSRLLQFAAPTFDGSLFEILGALCAGATLEFPAQDRPMVPDSSMIRFLESHRITHVTLPPAVLAILPDATLPDLRVLVSAGDTCPQEVVDRWAPGRVMINGYGPTECSVCATTARCIPGESRPPIGKPIANTRIHIIDAAGQELPIGAAGEISIGGVGLAKGYLNRPELEARSFVELPEIGRVYRTGDLGRWRTDGQIEHLGRVDRQAKIRGNRVDPVEVEAAIRSHPEVDDVAVITCGEAPMQWLAAYVTPHSSVDELRHHLAGRLPRYMMPTRIMFLSELPRTAHGKVDLAALPVPEGVAGESTQTPPRDSLDQRLQELWAKALGIQKPGIDDDFFSLGGDSLKAAFLGNEIERELNLTLPMAILLDQPTIRNVADQVRAVARGDVLEWPVILPLRPEGAELPFFCFPGANASGFYLQALAGGLSKDVPFYAFQWQGMEPGTQPLETVAELASLYVAEIRRARPHGPYRLGGHSIGGVIAFEVARRLEAAGEEVENVVIFDTTLVQPGDRNRGEELQEASFLSDLLRVCGWDPKRAEAFPVTDRGKLVDGPEVLSFVRRFLVEQSLLPYNCSEEQLKRVVAIWRAVAAAHDSYTPDGPISAPITLFLARELPFGTDVPRKEQRAEGWGWEPWTKGGLHLEWVDGNHVQILSPPHVAQVADRLNRSFGRDTAVQRSRE